MTLTELLKDSAFTPAQIQDLESRITIKEKRGKQIPHAICLVRNKEIAPPFGGIKKAQRKRRSRPIKILLQLV
jgi:hypothetical protein